MASISPNNTITLNFSWKGPYDLERGSASQLTLLFKELDTEVHARINTTLSERQEQELLCSITRLTPTSRLLEQSTLIECPLEAAGSLSLVALSDGEASAQTKIAIKNIPSFAPGDRYKIKIISDGKSLHALFQKHIPCERNERSREIAERGIFWSSSQEDLLTPLKGYSLPGLQELLSSTADVLAAIYNRFSFTYT